MTYNSWNNLIGDYFFSEERSGQTVFLTLTKQVLLEQYHKRYTDNRKDDEVWEDFMTQINCPTFYAGELQDDDSYRVDGVSYTKRIEQLFMEERSGRNKSRYPLPLAMLVFIVMAKGEVWASSNGAIIKNIKEFFKDNHCRFAEDDFDQQGQDDYLLKAICWNYIANKGYNGGIWKYVHDWSAQNDQGTLYFNFRKSQYATMVSDQCLLSATVKDRIRAIYGEVGLDPEANYPLVVFRGKLFNSKKLKNIIGQKALNALKKNIEIARILYDDFKNWNGKFENVDNNGNPQTVCQNHYLNLCANINEEENTFDVYYRIHERLDSAITVQIEGGGEVTIEPDLKGWSSKIKICKIKPIKNDPYRINFVTPGSNPEIYFVNHDYDFPGTEMLATESCLFNGYPVFFITKCEVDTEQGTELKRLPYSNVEGYSMYSYVVNINDPIMREGGLLNTFLYQESVGHEETVKLVGGLFLSRRGYLPYYLPMLSTDLNEDNLKIINTESRESVALQSLETGEQDNRKLWKIPANTLAGKYAVEGHEDVTFTILKPSIMAAPVVNVPYYDMSGRLLEEIPGGDKECKYMRDNNFTNDDIDYLTGKKIEDEYPSTYMCHTRNAQIVASEEDYTPSPGDILVEWLYFKGKCNKDDFAKVYDTIQSALLKERPELAEYLKWTNYGSALRWLENGGFICYDGRTIWPCTPRLFPLNVATDQCNKFRLVGCRPLNLLREMQNTCRKHRESLAFRFYETDNNYLCTRLTPTSVLLEVNGSEADNYGFNKITSYFCDGTPFNLPKPKPQIWSGIYRFLKSIGNAYEGNTGWRSNFLSFRNRCYVFKTEDYSFDAVPQRPEELLGENSPIKGVGFIHVEPFEQYHAAPDFYLVRPEDGKILMVDDESLAKLYVIAHSLGPNGDNDLFRLVKRADGSNDLAILKRVGLPKILSKILYLSSVEPPMVQRNIEEGNTYSYYVYKLYDDIDEQMIRSIIKDATNITTKELTRH